MLLNRIPSALKEFDARQAICSISSCLLLLSTAVGTYSWAAAPAATKAKPAATSVPKPADKPKDDKSAKPAANVEPVLENLVSVTPDDLVNKPNDYVGKNVKFDAHFFAFSNLALDYKPAYRASKTHLSFLVLRPNSHVPLSELKLAMMIPKEKDPESTLLAALKDGDQLEIVGKVYSAALDDPWVEIFRVKKLGPPEEKTVASSDKATDKKTIVDKATKKSDVVIDKTDKTDKTNKTTK